MVTNAKRLCMAPNLNYKSFVKKTYCKHGVVVVICDSDLSSLASVIFLLILPLRTASKSSFFRFGAFLVLLRVVLLCFATQSLQIAL